MSRLLKWIGAAVATPIVAAVAAVTALYLPPVQDFAVRRLTRYASEQTGMDIKVERLRLSPWADLKLDGLTAVDADGDTVVAARQATVDLRLRDIFKKRVFPLLDEGEKVFLIVIDNFRFDQWRTIMGELSELYHIDESLYCSILPTATQYARNAIFSGLMPNIIAEMFPELWVDEDSEEGKNLNEAPLIQTLFKRYRRQHTFSYNKVNDSAAAERLVTHLPQLEKYDVNVCVLNFIDMLSHARTESRMVRELASNEAAYRSITLSWFRHSAVGELFKTLASSNYRIILTTDHGSIRCQNPIRVKGDKNTNTNLRYKLGKNLDYNAKEVFEITDPHRAMLPSPNLSTRYIFARGDGFFAYPNNYNYYVSYYRDTFQHGGISMEEMLIPLIELTPRHR